MTADIKVGLVRVEEIRFHPHNVRQDLGDLRSLAASIEQYGVMQPVVVERHGAGLRLRAGHRRLAAAKIIGLTRIPAVIHSDALDDKDWLIHAVQENTMRRDMNAADRRRVVARLRELGCSWSGIGVAFGVSGQAVHAWVHEAPKEPARKTPRTRAVEALIAEHQAEFDELLANERRARPGRMRTRRRDEVDEVLVQRALDGVAVKASIAERRIVIDKWAAAGRSLNELQRIQGWNVWRDLREAAS